MRHLDLRRQRDLRLPRPRDLRCVFGRNAKPLEDLDIQLHKIIVHDLQSQDGSGSDADVFGIDIDNGNVKLSNSIIYNLLQTTANGSAVAEGVLIQGGSNHYLHNNTFFNIKNTGSIRNAQGIRREAGTVTVKNTVILDVDSTSGPEACFLGTLIQSNNVSSDATAVGPQNQTAYATYFQNITDGSEDLHLLNDSNTLWGSFGLDLDTDPNLPVTNDIDGGARDANNPDIGADEFGAAPPSLTLADHGATQVGDQFTIQTSVTDVLFRFNLSRFATVTVDNIRVNFTIGGGVANGDVSNGELYRDVNNNGVFDSGTDTLVLGSVTPVAGVLAFNTLSEDPSAGTNYIVRATVNNLNAGDTTTFSVGTADIDVVEGGVIESGSITNVVHTRDAGAVIYYSVGTDNTALYSDTASASTGVLTLNSAAANNIGAGDEIREGANRYYITGRNSTTEFTIQNSAANGGTPGDTNITFASTAITIFRTFNALTTAEAGSADANHLNTLDLVAGGFQLNWACYNDGAMDDNVDINGWTTGAANYIRIFTPTNPNEVGASQRHTGKAGTGFRIAQVIDLTLDNHHGAIWIRDDHIRVEGIEIDGSGMANGGTVFGILVDGSVAATADIRYSHNIVHDLSNSTVHDTGGRTAFGLECDQGDCRISNNIVYDIENISVNAASEARGISVSDGNLWIYNNTVYKIINSGSTDFARGIVRSTGIATVTNNAVFDVDNTSNSTECGFCGSMTQGNNVSSDATAVGPQNQTAYASYFLSITDGSEDLHLLNDSNTLWGSFGADLDSDPDLPVTDDIGGDARDALTPDIGADEFGGVGGPTLTLANHGSEQVGDRFTTAASVTEVLYQFKLTRAGTFDVTELRVSFTTTDGVASGDVTSAELWQDLNGNGAVDGADSMVQGSITGSGGQLIFTTDFTPDAGAGTNYLVSATVNNLADGDFTTFSLSAAEITESVAVTETGSISNALHIQDPAPPSCSTSFTWLGTPLDVSPAGTGWVQVDVSATVPVGSTGVILQVVADAATDYDYGVRMNGSTDDWMVARNDDNLKAGTQRFYMVGVDAGRVFEVFQDSATITTYLVGYTGNGVTFFTNAINKSFDAPLNTYQDIDISADTGADTAIAGIFDVNNLASLGRMYALRNKGSTLDLYIETRADSFHTHVVGVNGSEVAEAKIDDAQVDLYLTGYITSGAVFFTTPVDKSTADTSYFDIDITPDIGADDANGAILEYFETGGNARRVAVRAKGETYDYYFDMRHHGAFVAIDINNIFQQKVEWQDMDTYLHGYTLASCGTPAPATNYRSIGTAGDYTTGDVAATNGSPVVVGNGTAWVTANRGRGDRIQIDATDYTILSVETNTQLTLAEPFAGTTDIGKAYTISRQYTTLQAWEDCISFDTPTSCSYFQVASADLVADNRSEVGIAYKDTTFALSADVIIDGSTTDSTHTITLTADGANRHFGIPGAGVVVDGQNAINNLRILDDNVTTEWLEFIQVRGADFGASVQVGVNPLTGPTNIVLRNLLVHDFFDASFEVRGIALQGAGGKTVTIRNCMIWDGDHRGIEGDDVADQLTVENCSIDNMAQPVDGVGVYTGSSTITVKNTIATSNPGGDFAGGGSFSASSTNNTASDGTAPGASPQTAAAAALFVAPNSDLHLKSGAVAIDTAVDLSPSFSSDIDGGSRPAGLSWDRGADEFGATTAVELISLQAVGVDGAVELTWETGSELDNLGFHLYRSLTEEGPYEQITSSVIPGLGSSPEGAKYAYRDSGLTNGVTYYYQLEDIETTGVTELHGPVSATPTAEVVTGGGGEEG